MRILWIDDEADVLYLCQAILSKQGHEVYTLQDSLRVLDTISETQPDVILVDHWMPGMTGLELTRQLKNSPYAAIPVIMCTSNPEIKEEAVKAGADVFITKPFSIDEVSMVIQRATQLRQKGS
ncbi:MAG: response regulator [Flavipsychrobacter sp.]|nr:response regulator [Flavipsychrobacter sp.]